ncbi:MAG: ribonuclease P protein component 4 [Candidatus Thorarchaeota archaeon]
MVRRNKTIKNIVKKIANFRILYLFQKAHEIFPQNQILANRYVDLARRYSQRAKINIPYHWRKRVCHKCKSFLYPGINCRYRMHSHKGKGSHVSLTCFECNKTTRYFINLKNDKNS